MVGNKMSQVGKEESEAGSTHALCYRVANRWRDSQAH